MNPFDYEINKYIHLNNIEFQHATNLIQPKIIKNIKFIGDDIKIIDLPIINYESIINSEYTDWMSLTRYNLYKQDETTYIYQNSLWIVIPHYMTYVVMPFILFGIYKNSNGKNNKMLFIYSINTLIFWIFGMPNKDMTLINKTNKREEIGSIMIDNARQVKFVWLDSCMHLLWIYFMINASISTLLLSYAESVNLNERQRQNLQGGEKTISICWIIDIIKIARFLYKNSDKISEKA